MFRKIVKNITKILSNATVRTIFASLALLVVEILVVGCATLISL